MKGTYVFGQGLGPPQTMILDELDLYIPRGSKFERATFADAKQAVEGFNKVMMAYFNPKKGWRITEKRMGEATPPPPERLVGWEPPASESQGTDIGKTPIHAVNDRLMINVERVEPADLDAALVAHRVAGKHLCLYARHKASAGLAGLMRNPWSDLETLVIDAFDQTVTRQASCRVGDLSVVLPLLPRLQRLYVGGQVGFARPIAHMALRHLSLLGNPLSASGLAWLAQCELPALQHVDLAVATEAAPDDGWLEAVVALVAKSPPLEALTLEGPFDSSEVVRALAPHADRLPRTLRLVSSARDEDEFVAAVAGLQGSRLTSLLVPAEDFVEDSLVALRKVVATVADVDTQFLPSAYGIDAFMAAVAVAEVAGAS